VAIDAVAEIKSRLDIIEVIGGYVALQRSGREFKGLCPFHAEKTPSFMVNHERQVWHCHGCGEGGDLFAFIEKIERIDFLQARDLLAERAGVELEPASGGGGRGSGKRRRRLLELNARAGAYFEHVLWATTTGTPGRELLEQRGVDEAAARRFGIGFAPAGGAAGDALLRYLAGKGGAEVGEVIAAGLAQPGRVGQARDRFRHRLVFPIRDERGQTVGFGGRALGDASPKYLNSPETPVYHKSSALFGLDLARAAISREQSAVVVEGYFDVVAAQAAGVEHTVASSGTAMTRDQVRMLGRYAGTIVLCFDNDTAGRAAASRAVDIVAAEGLQGKICRLPDDAKDPDDLVRRDPAAFAAAVAEAPPEWQVLLDLALGDAEGGNVEARRAAAEHAVALLARIPEAATRELYLQQAARRLDIGAQSLGADLAKAVRDGARRVQRIVLPQTAPPAAPPDEDVAAPDDTPMPRWEEYLGSIVVQQPGLARVLTESLGLELAEVTNATVKRLIEVALAASNGAFPLHQLTLRDQRHAARLKFMDVPELADDSDPAALTRAMADCVKLMHEESVRRSLATIQREMRRAKEQGRNDEVEALAAELHALAAQAPHLRSTLTTR
jgi:DNA primase